MFRKSKRFLRLNLHYCKANTVNFMKYIFINKSTLNNRIYFFITTCKNCSDFSFGTKLYFINLSIGEEAELSQHRCDDRCEIRAPVRRIFVHYSYIFRLLSSLIEEKHIIYILWKSELNKKVSTRIVTKKTAWNT